MSVNSADLDALVMQDIMAAATGETPAPTPAPDAQPEIKVEPAPAPVEAAPAATPDPPKAEEPKIEAQPPAPEADTIEIEWRGQKVKIEPEKRLELIQKGFDYTQKTMELAEFKRGLVSEVEQIRGAAKSQAEAIQALFNDPDKLEAIAVASRARQGQAPKAPDATPPSDPEEFISKADVQRMLQQVKEDTLKEVEKAKGTVKEDIELASMQASLQTEFDRTLDTLLKDKFPLLAEFGGDDVADRIRADALKFHQSFMTLNPGVVVRPEQIKAVMTESAKRRSEVIEGRLREREKQMAVKKQDLVTKGTEPKGGTAPPAPPTGKPLKLNDPSLDAQVLREIQSIMGQ